MRRASKRGMEGMSMSGNDVIAVAASIPRLGMRLFFSYLRFRRKIKKGARTFRKELVRSGLEKRTANLLAEEYSRSGEAFSLRNLGTMMLSR